MNEPILIGLLKRKLNITWDDEDTTARLEEIIESAIPTLKHKLGIVDEGFDFSEPGAERTLFINYCFYERNHVANEFDDNYSNEIAQIREKHEVANYQADSEESADAES